MNINHTRLHFDEGKTTSVAGRVVAVRSLSKKLSFVVIQDTDAKIQIGIRSGNVPSRFDIIEATGEMRRSKTDELTVWDDNPRIVVKNQGELPSHSGISDPEVDREKRYVQLIINDELRSAILLRSNIIFRIRQHLHENGFVEIETPILSTVPSGATAKPFVTKSEALNVDFFLRIATEIPLKKALIGGIERVFEIGKIFRNEGVDRTHNPEFTSIELYQSYGDLESMRLLLCGLFMDFGIDITKGAADFREYDDLVKEYGRDFDERLIKPTFVFGQPAEDTPLCKLRPDGKCDRFEFYMNGYEIANAYNELTDSEEQTKRMEGKNDDGLSEALKYGMPPTGGMGIGIDRLVMALTKSDVIHDVILFPTKRNATR